MTIRECYIALGGDYDEVLGRLIKEEMVQKFLLKFLEDKSYASLKAALQEQDMENAFRMTHTLKGLCVNLGITKLYEAVNRLVEELRPGEWRDFSTSVMQVDEEYTKAVSAIQMLKETTMGRSNEEGTSVL